MKIFFVVVLVIAGGWYWQKGHSAQSLGFDQAGNPVVVAFTVANCEPCTAAIKILESRGVPVEEKLIDPADDQDDNVKAWKKVGGNVFPVVLSGNSKVTNSSKWELIALLGKNYGEQYLTQDEQTYFQQHFDATGAPNIVLYGTSWCPNCAALRKEFDEQGVSFIDVDVEKSSEFDKLIRVMEIPGYPAVWVGYTRVHGTTYKAVKAVMDQKV